MANPIGNRVGSDEILTGDALRYEIAKTFRTFNRRLAWMLLAQTALIVALLSCSSGSAQRPGSSDSSNRRLIRLTRLASASARQVPPRYVLAHQPDRPLHAELPVLQAARGRADLVEIGAHVVELVIQSAHRVVEQLNVLAAHRVQGHHQDGGLWPRSVCLSRSIRSCCAKCRVMRESRRSFCSVRIGAHPADWDLPRPRSNPSRGSTSSARFAFSSFSQSFPSL